MSTVLFPSIQPSAAVAANKAASGLYREVKWDYENNTPVFINGSPAVITGKEAVLVWAWKALNTPRFRYAIYTWDYGNEAETLIGRPFTAELKQAEAARFVRECLVVNPYITDVKDISVSFSEDKLSLSCTVSTVYGECGIDV